MQKQERNLRVGVALLLTGLTAGVLSGLGCTEPSPTPTLPQRPSDRLIVPPTPIPQGVEGVTFPSDPAPKPEIVLPPGWKFFRSEDLFFRIIIPSSWVLNPDPYPVVKKVAERFLGEVIEGHQNYLDISAWRAGFFNDKDEWITIEDYITEESQMLEYFERVSVEKGRKGEEIVVTGYWPRAIDGSRAWFLEIHNPSENLLYTKVIFIKLGRLWTLTYSARYENSGSGYLEEKRKFETLVDSFRSP